MAAESVLIHFEQGTAEGIFADLRLHKGNQSLYDTKPVLKRKNALVLTAVRTSKQTLLNQVPASQHPSLVSMAEASVAAGGCGKGKQEIAHPIAGGYRADREAVHAVDEQGIVQPDSEAAAATAARPPYGCLHAFDPGFQKPMLSHSEQACAAMHPSGNQVCRCRPPSKCGKVNSRRTPRVS